MSKVKPGPVRETCRCIRSSECYDSCGNQCQLTYTISCAVIPPVHPCFMATVLSKSYRISLSLLVWFLPFHHRAGLLFDNNNNVCIIRLLSPYGTSSSFRPCTEHESCSPEYILRCFLNTTLYIYIIYIYLFVLCKPQFLVDFLSPGNKYSFLHYLRYRSC